MFNLFERTIAWRYLKAPRQEGFVSVIAGFSFIGITLGVATLIIVMAVMNGFRAELYQKLIGMRGQIIVMCGPNETDWKNHYKIITQENHITESYPILEKQAILIYSGISKGVGIMGVRTEDLLKRELINNDKLQGNFSGFQDKTVALGSKLAHSLGISLGDQINLLLPDGSKTPFGNLPKQITLNVGAIFEIGMHEFDKNIILLPLDTVQRFFSSENIIDCINISIDNQSNSDKVMKSLSQKLPSTLKIVDWKHGDNNVFQAVQVEKNVMFLILMLIIIIAAFNVISGLIMLVKDKTKDIAILKTMGANHKNILKIFFLTGSCIGVAGTLIGVSIGVSFSLNIDYIKKILERVFDVNLFNSEVYFLSKLPAKIIYSEVVEVAAITLIITLVSTFYPAYRAARLDPVEALRL